MKKITFNAYPDVAENLDELASITRTSRQWLINLILASILDQIADGDSSVLRAFIYPQRFDTKEQALAVIGNYDAFVAKVKSEGCKCFHEVAAPARTRDGQWEILFKCTHPGDHGELEKPRYR